MSDEAVAAYGYRLLRGVSGSPPSYATIGEITSLTPGPISADMVETTHGESEEGWEEYIPTIIRSGVVTVEVNYLPSSATIQEVQRDLVDRVKSGWIIELSGRSPLTEWEFDAYVQSFAVGAMTPEAKMSATIELRITGEMDLGI